MKLLTLIMGILIGAAIVYFGFMPKSAELAGPIEYNCTLSGGAYEDGSCVCPLDMNQTQDQMYDKQTGFCQSSIGGPAGDAFAASIGLPYGEYGYYQNIILDLCEQSGGSVSGAACVCPAETDYSKITGKCE